MKNLSSKTVVDLGKVAYADFVYRNDTTKHEWKEKPKGIWINGTNILPNESIRIGPHLMSMQAAIHTGVFKSDTFTPVFKAQLCNSHSLEFTGKKAYQLWQLYLKRLKIKTEPLKGTPDKKKAGKNNPSMQLELL